MIGIEEPPYGIHFHCAKKLVIWAIISSLTADNMLYRPDKQVAKDKDCWTMSIQDETVLQNPCVTVKSATGQKWMPQTLQINLG